MRALAGYILRGRMQAIAVTSLFGFLALVIPPAAYLLSGVPIALVTLRIGITAGIQVMLGALLVLVLGLIIMGSPPVLALGMVLGVWLPVTLCAASLHYSHSQAKMLLTAAGIAAAYIALLHIMLGDLTEWWRSQLLPPLEQALQGRSDITAEQLLEGMMPFINGMVAAGLVFSLGISVMLGRWLQAMLFNPGGFGEEFRSLILPRWLVVATVAALAGAILLEGSIAGWLRDLVFITMTLFLFQGLALCHLQVKVRGWAVHWLWLLYALLVLLPQFVLFVASMGLADAWLRNGRSLTPPNNGNGGGNTNN